MNSILIVDDEKDIRDILEYSLKKEGFTVYTAVDGKQGIEKTKEYNPDLILLDVMMPDMDGIEVCETIRADESLANSRICFLTARNEDYSQIAGLDAGADDFVSKPIKPRVLISRIKAILRRSGGAASDQKDMSGRLIIDREKYFVQKNGEEIHLPKKEFELLSLLSSKPEKVFDRDVILKTVWGEDVVVGDRTIDVHIRKLREKIGNEHIKTVKGVGYKFHEA